MNLNVKEMGFSIRDEFLGEEEGAFDLDVPMVHLHIGPLDINVGTVKDVDDLIVRLKEIRKEAFNTICGGK